MRAPRTGRKSWPFHVSTTAGGRLGTTREDGTAGRPSPDELSAPALPLDDLASRALAGDPSSERALFGALRERFLSLAKQRVQRDDQEDVVQDALRVVLARYGTRPSAVGILPWSLMVLRNVIGNYYQRRSREEARLVSLDDREESREGTVPLTSPSVDIDLSCANDRVTAAISLLSRERPKCGAIFRHILESLAEGGRPREVSRIAMQRVRADHPEMSAGSFYVALHRCRSRLQEILRGLEEGEGP